MNLIVFRYIQMMYYVGTMQPCGHKIHELSDK
uniref:Uncharacterized protein n=1 Tax=Anguilla anguilla TaxID=7936 RepID=A0A0E9QVQ7_ANGAN